MPHPFARVARVVVCLAVVLTIVGLAPKQVAAQNDAARFAAALAARSSTPSLAGPFSGDLVQEDGFNTTAVAGVTLADFSVSATFANPAESNAPNWDVGISFRRNGDEVQQVVVDSAGNWYNTPYPAGTQGSGIVTDFDASPGGSNTIDLIVQGTQALLGVNGTFVSTLTLAPGVAADVEVGTGYFVGSVVPGRAIAYSEFQVWPAPAQSAPVATFPPTATSVPTSASSPTPDTGVTQGAQAAVSPADATRFADVLAAQATVAPLSGPYSANLRETTGAVTLAYANLNVTDFHATVTSTASEIVDGVPWDIGFMFGSTLDGTLRIAVDANQQVYFSTGAGAPAVIGQATNLLASPGDVNTLDLMVSGGTAWFGVNGVLAATAALPAGVTASDVSFGSGFYSDQIAPDRLNAFENFAVLPLPADAFGGGTEQSSGPTPDEISTFQAWVAQTDQIVPLVGPFAGRLVESALGSPAIAPAGVSLTNFGATATFANPQDASGALWDIGIRFHGDGTAFNRIVVDSLGDVYLTHRGENAQKLGSTTNFDATASGSNTLQLFVEGDQAYFGVNGELVAAITLTAAPIAADVQIGTGFFNEDYVVGRVTDYTNFRVWEIT